MLQALLLWLVLLAPAAVALPSGIFQGRPSSRSHLSHHKGFCNAHVCSKGTVEDCRQPADHATCSCNGSNGGCHGRNELVVNISSCRWLQSTGKLAVRWTAPAGGQADYFELQFSETEDSHAFAVFSTARVSINLGLDLLMPSTSYWLRIRAHAAGTPSLGPGTWGLVGTAGMCTTGVSETPLVWSGLKDSRDTSSFFIEPFRFSENTLNVDYLQNHDSADMTASAMWMAQMASSPEQIQPVANATFNETTWTLFCVEMLNVSLPGTVTTMGNNSFADYLSCNNNDDHSNPQCHCVMFEDRTIGQIDTNACHQFYGGYLDTSSFQWIYGKNLSIPCLPQLFGPSFEGCVCSCTSASLKYSRTYIGMQPAFGYGVWYSHPKETECTEDVDLGGRLNNGRTCTWKRSPMARVVHGEDLVAGGLIPDDDQHMEKYLAENIAVIKKTIAKAPVQPWQCSGRYAAAVESLLI